MTVNWSWSARRCWIGIPGGNRFRLRFTSSTTWLYSGWLLNSSSVGTGSHCSRSTPSNKGQTLLRKSSTIETFMVSITIKMMQSLERTIYQTIFAPREVSPLFDRRAGIFQCLLDQTPFGFLVLVLGNWTSKVRLKILMKSSIKITTTKVETHFFQTRAPKARHVAECCSRACPYSDQHSPSPLCVRCDLRSSDCCSEFRHFLFWSNLQSLRFSFHYPLLVDWFPFELAPTHVLHRNWRLNSHF